jgi:hypothetical protein
MAVTYRKSTKYRGNTSIHRQKKQDWTMAEGLRSLPAFQPTVLLYVKSQKKREAIKPGIHLIRYIIDGYFRSNI